MDLAHPSIKPLAYAALDQEFIRSYPRSEGVSPPVFVLCSATKLFLFQKPEITAEMIEQEGSVSGNPLKGIKLAQTAELATIIWPYVAILSAQTVYISLLEVAEAGATLTNITNISIQHPVAYLVGHHNSEDYIFVACSSTGSYTVFTTTQVIAHGSTLKTTIGSFFWRNSLVFATPTQLLIYADVSAKDQQGQLQCVSSHNLPHCPDLTLLQPINVQFLSTEAPSCLYIIIETELFILSDNQLESVSYLRRIFHQPDACCRALSFIQGLNDQNFLIAHTMDTLNICTFPSLQTCITVPLEDEVLVTFSTIITEDLLFCISRTTGIFYIPIFHSIFSCIGTEKPQQAHYIYTDNLLVSAVIYGSFITAPNLPLHHILVTENESVLLCETPNVNVEFLGTISFRDSKSITFLAAGHIIICERNLYYQGYWDHPMPEPTRDAIQQVFIMDGNPAAPPDHYVFITNNQLVIYKVVFSEKGGCRYPNLEQVTYIDIVHSYGHGLVVHNMVAKLIYEGVDIISIALQVDEKGQLLDFPCLWDPSSESYVFEEPSRVDNFQFPQLFAEKSVTRMLYGFPSSSEAAFFVSSLCGELFFRCINEVSSPLEHQYAVEKIDPGADSGVDFLLHLKDKADKVPISCQFFHENTLYMMKESHLLIIYDFHTLRQRTYDLRRIVSADSNAATSTASLGVPKAILQTNSHVILLVDLILYYVSYSTENSYYDLYQIYSQPVSEIYRLNSATERFIALSYLNEQACFFELSIAQCSNGLFFEDKWTFEGHHLFSEDIDPESPDLDVPGKTVQVFQTANTMMVYLPRKQRFITCSVTTRIRDIELASIETLSPEQQGKYLCDAFIMRRKFRKIIVNLAELSKEHTYEHKFAHIHFFSIQNTPLILRIFEHYNLDQTSILKLQDLANDHHIHTDGTVRIADPTQLNAILYGIFGYCNSSRRIFLLGLFIDCIQCFPTLLKDTTFSNMLKIGMQGCERYMTVTKPDPALIFLRTTANNCSPELKLTTVGLEGLLDSCQLDDCILFFTKVGYCYMYEIIINPLIESCTPGCDTPDLVVFRLTSYINICELVKLNAAEATIVCVGKSPIYNEDTSNSISGGHDSRRIHLIIQLSDSYYLLAIDFCNTLYSATCNSITPLLCAKPTSLIIVKDYALVAWKNNILLLHLPEGVLLKTYTIPNNVLNIYYSNGSIIVFSQEGRVWRLSVPPKNFLEAIRCHE